MRRMLYTLAVYFVPFTLNPPSGEPIESEWAGLSIKKDDANY